MTRSDTPKFTPGPWAAFTAPNGETLIGIGEATGEGIADCGFGLWRSGAEKLANARLIAAAPDLYEALNGLVHAARAILERGHERITELGGECDPVAKMFASDPAIQSAVAALSKAEGRS